LRILRLKTFFISDEIFIKWQYKKVFGRVLNLKNPVGFNEKIQWLKLNWRDEILTICSDKYKVRDYVKSRLSEQVLTRLYGVYDRAEDIVSQDFPESFVLKVTHGSGQNIICRNKKEIDWKHTLALLRIYMANNHFYESREFGYKNIIPKIICEEYLDEGGRSPIDYKFHCFNGVPRFVEIHFDRFGDRKVNIYDLNWNLLPFTMTYPNFTGEFNKPKHFGEMCDYASRLSKDMIFVRVDFYNLKGKIYFGEMTFYPASGVDIFTPEYYDLIFGSFLHLPNKKNCGTGHKK
jgi:hypothetical protein